MEPLHCPSNAARAPDTSIGPIFNWVLAPLLRSVTNLVLTHFAHSHLGGNLTLLDRELGAPSLHSSAPWGGTISLRSTAKWVLHCFAPSHPGGRPHFARSLTIIRFPFNRTNVWDHAIPSLLLSEIVLAIASNLDLRK